MPEPLTPHYATFCKACWQVARRPIALRGVLSAPYRAFGLRPSRMNPNCCTYCELMFETVMRARNVTIDATILFADLRGFTRLSQSISTSAMSGLLDTFYDECANAIWAHDGILNKTIGDAVMAVFNFPIHQDDHPRQAVLAARQIQMRCGSLREEIGAKLGLETDALAVGVGIDTGELSFGEFGRSHRDLTAIGTVVNTASRAQSVAESGQILVTEAVRDKMQPDMAGSQARTYKLKGFDADVRLYHA